ncbi:MAG TPA: phosphotransferase [Pirellulaceae bacterium]|nr:phosphotransferase [Pirellulaceae bacterium]
MSDQATVASVLSHYPDVVARNIDPLNGAGGFSGAAFWRITTGETQLCLRRWPQEHPNRAQLQSIHDVLCHVSVNGFAKLPIPFRARDSQTYVSLAGHLWELTRWMPGQADFHEHPTSERLNAAMLALAQFHRGAENLGLRAGSPPGIVHRREQLERLSNTGTDEMLRAVVEMESIEFAWRAASILSLFDQHASKTKPLLAAASHARVPRQPCIRDVWHDHVLFEGDEVSGIIDFGALQTDHVACDISRLLGSLAGGDRAMWERGLTAYQTLRPLAPDELMLVDAYDRSTVLLSGMNWVQWIAVEGRQFEDEERVSERLNEILARLLQM